MNAIFKTNLSYLICALASLATVASTQAQETTRDDAKVAATLTQGVDFIPPCGAPGPIATLGEGAFPVLFGQVDDGSFAPVVSAAWVKQGRVLAFGHTDYCRAASIQKTPSSTAFFKNAIFWASGKENVDASSIRIAIWRDADAAQCLKSLGFDARSVGFFESGFDVYVGGSWIIDDANYARLFEAVRAGSGFITSGLGWGWSQLNPSKSLVVDHPGNKNFAKYGVPLAWTDGISDPTDRCGYDCKLATNVPSQYVDGVAVLNLLKQGKEAIKQTLQSSNPSELKQISTTANLIYRFLSEENKSVFDNFADSNREIVPTPKNPVRAVDLFDRLTILIQTERYLRSQEDGEVANIPALPAADDFPGAAPKDAPRLNDVVVRVKTATPNWNSTGLYAAPGETITVRVKPEIFAKFPRPFAVRIGAHSDRLWNRDKWTRYPEITLEKKLSAPETQIANPFGGAIYIVVPNGIASAGLGVVDFEISGGIAAPYFVKDETSLEDWKTTRQAPAPWAELQGRNVVLSVPSEVVRNLDDPQALMETWDEILDLEAEFAAGPYVRVRPERICCDREISAGYMHSGYPVMTHMDVQNVLVDNQRLLTKGDWGFFHEFGHNHQSPYWTFEGSTEVTVNYFSLYVMEKLCGLTPDKTRGELTKESRLKALKKYLDGGAKFEQWKNDPFLALNMTVQLRDEFGWEPFLRAVSEYKKAPRETLPRNDQEKRDQWLVRLSRNCNKNLGPFFEKWGVPTSQEARDSVKNLPVWLPAEFDEL